MRIAINGAGIAGPTLAHWLQRSGHDVLLVERSPQLRTGGYVVDFWGLGYDIAEKMGILPRVRELGYQVREVRFVDDAGHKAGGFAVDSFRRVTGDRFTTVGRTDLAATIYDTLDGHVETVFGDSIAGIAEERDCVRVSFERGAAREVDLVIGADGLHSRVRELVFGPVAEIPLGFHVAAIEVDGYRPHDDLVYVTYGVPGKAVSRFAMRNDRTMFLFIVCDEHITGEPPATDAARKAMLRDIFGGIGWECPQILAAMENAGELYFDVVSQIRMDRWSKGRTALIGDAGACPSFLAGEGTGLAMAEAYVLAGELHACGGDFAAAFARFESRMKPFVDAKQLSALKFAGAFAPRTAFGVKFRNLVTRLAAIPGVADFYVRRELRDDFELPDYGY